MRFHNVPSFAVLDQTVQVPGLGEVHFDLGYGGAFYAYVSAPSVGLQCRPEDFTQLVERGKLIKKAVMAQHVIRHPFEEDLSFLYGVIFVDQPHDPKNHSRNVCVFADGEIDRSPTGTGVSGRLAIHYARGEIALGQRITIESILGTSFTGQVVQETVFGPHKAVIPEVEGAAFITGMNTFFMDPQDPLAPGFLLR